MVSELVLGVIWCVGWIVTADRLLCNATVLKTKNEWEDVLLVYFTMFFMWPMFIVVFVLAEAKRRAPEIEVPERYRNE